MKFYLPTKIILILLGLMLLAALAFIVTHYSKLKQVNPPSTVNAINQPAGTCSPDLKNCSGSPQLCMTENLNKVCE